MKIKVTRYHIFKGTANRAGLCAVALAVKEAVKEKFPNKYVAVTYTGVHIGESIWEHESYILPLHVTTFIRKFDACSDSIFKKLWLRPIEFELNI